jgi:hypothetical protein
LQRHYPTISIIEDTTLAFKNVITVQNAMNIGVGVSYDLSGILKNATNVKSPKAKLWKYKT